MHINAMLHSSFQVALKLHHLLSASSFLIFIQQEVHCIQNNTSWLLELCLRMASLVAIVGKRDEPLFFWTEESEDESLALKQLSHGALDVIEERMDAVKADSKSVFDLYMGQLMTSGDYEIFGYISNTRIKVIVICGAMYNTLTDDNSPRNNKQLMRSFMLSIYGFYVAAMMNPLRGLDEPCRGERFASKVEAAARKFSSSLRGQES